MLFYIFSFMCGDWIIAYFAQPPPPLKCVSVFIFLGILSTLCWRLCHLKWHRILCVSINCACLGFCCADYHAHQWLMHRLENRWVGKEIIVTGVIASLPQEEKHYSRFLLRTEQFAAQHESRQLQLIWQQPHPLLRVGDRWKLSVRLKPPHSLVNFNSLNRMRNLWAQNIHAMGYVVSQHPYKKLSRINAWHFWMSRKRQALQQEIADAVKDHSAASVITALTIGVEAGLSEADWQVLQRTGTVHLVVIAGLHIGLMVMVAYFCASKIWRLFPRLLTRFPAQRVGAGAALIFALSYGALSGFNFPAQRAVIMTVILMLSKFLACPSDPWRRLLLAFGSILILEPGALFSAGFWLSFAAVGWITYSTAGDWRHAPHWKQWLRIQCALFLGLTPLTIFFFQQFSSISMIANPPAILWVGWVIVPLCLLAVMANAVSVSMGKLIFKSAAYLLNPLWRFLEWLASWPLAAEHRAFSHQWLLWIALCAAAWFLAPRRLPARWAGLLGLLPIWLLPPPKPPPGAYWVTLMDVGQGLALTVQTAHHLLIYDTGPHIPDGFDAGRDIITPYLISLGVRKIDLLMVSHSDNDHSGGAVSLLTRWSVKNVLTSQPSLFRTYHAKHCRAGQQWQWDGVSFQILAPDGDAYEGNNSSCVLQIGQPKQRMLLTGDIEASRESTLIQRYGTALRSQVLVVPHHGSKTSSTEEFLRLVQPNIAWFSLGFYNCFHFPAPSVVARYQSLGVQQWSTDMDGALMLRMPADGPPFVVAANPHHYFWQLPNRTSNHV